MSGSAEQDYFVDGITEDIITELSRYKNLAVVARNTTFTYKGQSVDVSAVGRKLGADYVLEGSIRVAGQRVRATVQLIDAGTGAHVFADKFDRAMEDIFGVQDEIVEAILGRLSFNLQDAAGNMRARNPTTSISAYTSWLRAGAALRQGEEKEARSHLHAAVDLDPHYGPALAALSMDYAFWRFTEPNAQTDEQRKQDAKRYAERAIAAGKGDPAVLINVASCFVQIGEINEALRYSEMALALSPRNMNNLVTRGYILSFAGKHADGLSLVERACRVELLLPPSYISCLGDCLLLARRFEDADTAYQRLLDPSFMFKFNRAACLVLLGRMDEARCSVPAFGG